MTITFAEVVSLPAATDAEPDVEHLVCHCTDDSVAACYEDVTNEPWTDGPDDLVCALCLLAWPLDAATCPWGCACDDCGPIA